MKKIFHLNLKLLTILLFTIMSTKTVKANKSNFITLKTSKGSIVIKTLPKIAPNHVKRIKDLVSSGFYNGIIFHRVIEGFMAQTGDPTGTGMGGSDLPDIRAEFTSTPFERGTLGMARSQHPDSANSQFFICFQEASFLNNQYTVFGRVKEGMEFIDKIVRGEPPEFPDKIVSIRLSENN